MILATMVAAIMFGGVVVYAVFAGADFGTGLWDLTAGNAERGIGVRKLAEHSIGPVWEANHVWLIFVLVYLWTGFPTAFAATMTTLVVPWSLAAGGMVLRGSAFAFRKFAPTFVQARLFGAVFAASSLLTPFFLGAAAGAIASGRVPLDGSGGIWRPWLHPSSFIGGALAVMTCSFLAATFLASEADRLDDVDLAEAFRRRALASGALTGVVALVAVIPLRRDAPRLFEGLTGKALPLVLVSAAAGMAALSLLWRRRPRPARVAAAVAVAAVVLGWGFGQYPYILEGEAPRPGVRIADAAGARATLVALLIVSAVAALIVVPPLVFLFRTTERADDATPAKTV